MLADTPSIAKEVESLILQAGHVLNLPSNNHINLVDKAIMFSILRGFFSTEEIQWDEAVKEWMESASQKTNVILLK